MTTTAMIDVILMVVVCGVLLLSLAIDLLALAGWLRRR